MFFEVGKKFKDSPCHAYECENFDKCRDGRLACIAFQRYVVNNRCYDPKGMVPTREIFDFVNSDVEA